jgi:hypothetical protein
VSITTYCNLLSYYKAEKYSICMEIYEEANGECGNAYKYVCNLEYDHVFHLVSKDVLLIRGLGTRE